MSSGCALIFSSKMLSGGDRDHAEPPAGAAEILGVGVGADGVPRQVAEERLEVRDEGAVDVVRQDDQVRPLGVHQVDDLLDRLREEGTGRRIARIDEEERLDLRILQRLQVLVRELEAVLLLGADENRLQVVVLELRHLEIGGEDRRAEGDGVAGIEQALVLQRLEDVAHGRGAALDRVEVELHVRAVAGTHRPHEIFVGNGLVVDEGAIRHRVVVADDAVGQLVDEVVRREDGREDGEDEDVAVGDVRNLRAAPPGGTGSGGRNPKCRRRPRHSARSADAARDTRSALPVSGTRAAGRSSTFACRPCRVRGSSPHAA